MADASSEMIAHRLPRVITSEVDYDVALAALALHRHLLDYIQQQRDKVWREIRVHLASGQWMS